MKQESNRHNTNKDRKFNKRKFTRKNSTKMEREGKAVADTAIKEEDALVGGRSCLRDSHENDPEWYAQDPQLLKDAFSLSIADRLGSTLTVPTSLNGSTAFPYLSNQKWTVPGVYTIQLAPVPGISTSASSAVNVAAKKLFTFIRHANSGAANYQAPDLMMYMLAMDNGYTLWNWLVRLYGVARVYSTKNAYLPVGLLKTMKVDVDDITSNLNTLRTIINKFGAKLSTMKVPSHLSYFKRHAWLFSNVFADSDSEKAQNYLYNPSVLFRWVENPSVSGQLPYLEPVAITDQSFTGTWKMDGIRTLVDSFIDPIFYSEDFSIMSGDILKAYGADKCYSVPSIQEDYAVLPVHNYEVAMQFENAHIPGGVVTPTVDSWRITQSNDEAIIFNPAIQVNRADLKENFLYNFHSNEVGPESVAVATRINLLVDPIDAQFSSDKITGSAELQSCGSEIATRAYALRFTGTNYGDPVKMWDYTDITSNFYIKGNTDAQVASACEAMCAATQFDWAPLMYVYKDTAGTPDATEATFTGVIGDLDNYTMISLETLASMNDVALLSMFGIPGSAGV